jgi:hypothetical protein
MVAVASVRYVVKRYVQVLPEGADDELEDTLAWVVVVVVVVALGPLVLPVVVGTLLDVPVVPVAPVLPPDDPSPASRLKNTMGAASAGLAS